MRVLRWIWLAVVVATALFDLVVINLARPQGYASFRRSYDRS